MFFDSKEVERNPFINKNISHSEKLKLTKEQQKAFEEIEEAIDDEMHSKFLLFGVTGSGKTEVYLQLIEKVLNERKNKYYACTRNFTYSSNCR